MSTGMSRLHVGDASLPSSFGFGLLPRLQAQGVARLAEEFDASRLIDCEATGVLPVPVAFGLAAELALG